MSLNQDIADSLVTLVSIAFGIMAMALFAATAIALLGMVDQLPTVINDIKSLLKH